MSAKKFRYLKSANIYMRNYTITLLLSEFNVFQSLTFLWPLGTGKGSVFSKMFAVNTGTVETGSRQQSRM